MDTDNLEVFLQIADEEKQKDFGVTFNETLKFHTHIGKVATLANAKVGMVIGWNPIYPDGYG